jgi:hypothetical protein
MCQPEWPQLRAAARTCSLQPRQDMQYSRSRCTQSGNAALQAYPYLHASTAPTEGYPYPDPNHSWNTLNPGERRARLGGEDAPGEALAHGPGQRLHRLRRQVVLPTLT